MSPQPGCPHSMRQSNLDDQTIIITYHGENSRKLHRGIDMINVGDTVEAQVYREEPYGLFLRSDEDEIYVNVREISWTSRGLANERALLGKNVLVKILKKTEKKISG